MTGCGKSTNIRRIYTPIPGKNGTTRSITFTGHAYAAWEAEPTLGAGPVSVTGSSISRRNRCKASETTGRWAMTIWFRTTTKWNGWLASRGRVQKTTSTCQMGCIAARPTSPAARSFFSSSAQKKSAFQFCSSARRCLAPLMMAGQPVTTAVNAGGVAMCAHGSAAWT